MKFWKYLFRILVGIFALIGLLVTIAYCFIAANHYYISIYDPVVAAEAENIELLKQYPFKPDTVQYQFAAVRDSAHAQKIMDYFKLDTLYSPDATTWEKAVAISKFVATNIPHAQPENSLNIQTPSPSGNILRKLIPASTAACTPSSIMS